MDVEKSLTEIFKESLKSDKTQLPPFNKTALQIQHEIGKQDPNIKKIEAFIEVDQALTAMVLKMANTAFFRGLSKVETVRDAIVRLGLQQVANIVMLVTHKKNFQSKDSFIQSIMENLWRHSVGVALGCSWLAKRCGYPQQANQAFVAGLLHDIGKLFLLTVMESVRRKKIISFEPSQTFTTEIMAGLHTEQGYLLAQNWNLPENYAIVARDHHEEKFDTRNSILVIVRMVNKTCNKLGISVHEPTDAILVTTPEAVALGLSEVDIAELEIMLEDAPILMV
ncbi:MAG: HDOD domain-containing protein [Deltaproteobacteria bacterium]|nr:HDOD domain-containing protein [Deltaproteobacteria bacterium]